MDNKIKYVIIIVVILIIALIAGIYYVTINNEAQLNMNSMSSDNYSSSFYLNPISGNEVAAYKASCIHIPLNDMFQSPDSYK